MMDGVSPDLENPPVAPDPPDRLSPSTSKSSIADAAAEDRGKIKERVRAVLQETSDPDPTIRKKTQPKLWRPTIRAAKLEYVKLGKPTTGGVKKPPHKRRPLTPGWLAKLVWRRPYMSTTELTEFLSQRYHMTGEAMKGLHNQILAIRAADRRRCRKIRDLIPIDRTAEATSEFYREIVKAVREARCSGSEQEFI